MRVIFLKIKEKISGKSVAVAGWH